MPGVQFRRGIPLAYRRHLYCFDPLNKSAVSSLLSPARVKRCVLPEKREMRWFHGRLFRELIVPELGDRYVAEYFWESTPVPSAHAFRPPRLESTAGSLEAGRLRQRALRLVNPTSGWRQKSWLPECWARDAWVPCTTRPSFALRHDQCLGRLAGSALPRDPGTSRVPLFAVSPAGRHWRISSGCAHGRERCSRSMARPRISLAPLA